MNIKDEFPWVVVDNNTYDIISVGTFDGLSNTKRGHLMTYRTWKQIVEERGLSPKKDLILILESTPV